jgi:hypothetical protein
MKPSNSAIKLAQIRNIVTPHVSINEVEKQEENIEGIPITTIIEESRIMRRFQLIPFTAGEDFSSSLIFFLSRDITIKITDLSTYINLSGTHR